MGGTCCAGNKVSPDLGEISGRRVLKVVFEAQRCLLSFFFNVRLFSYKHKHS